MIAVKYTLARLSLLFASIAGVFILTQDQLLALIGGAAISMALSFVLMRGLREEMVQWVQERAERKLAARIAAGDDNEVEDLAQDATAATQTRSEGKSED